MQLIIKLSCGKQAEPAACTANLVCTAGSIKLPVLFNKSGRRINTKVIPFDDTKQRDQESASFNFTKIKSIVQGLALLTFFVLLLTKRGQFWLIILLTGFVSSLLFGRIYCGWVCPVNTINGLIDLLFKKLRINKPAAPKWLQNRLAGSIVFVLFLSVFILSLILRVRPQLFTVISLAGVLASAVFTSSVWCNYLCPWGTILKNTSRFSYYRLSIRVEQCVRCGKCSLNCPAKSIDISPDKQTIDCTSCLQCLKCHDICNKDAIQIRRNRRFLWKQANAQPCKKAVES